MERNSLIQNIDQYYYQTLLFMEECDEELLELFITLVKYKYFFSPEAYAAAS